MNSLRIGCDRIIRWSITSGGEPYDLSGKNIRLKVSTRSTQFYVSTDDFSIDGNKIIWLFRGKDQKHLGPYTLTYIENEGMDDMLTFDRCNAFNFVACSCQESRSSSKDMEISNIDLSSEITALGVKLLPNLIPLTYQELFFLRASSGLIPGAFYRITDYVTTTSQENTRSAGHQFDLVVLALSEDALSERAYAMLHEVESHRELTLSSESGTAASYRETGETVEVQGHTYYRWDRIGGGDSVYFNTATPTKGSTPYFLQSNGNMAWDGYFFLNIDPETVYDSDVYFHEAGANLSTWQIWYCLDNDTDRFAWADAANGKGVIYRMIDEHNNDLPYDFKNIQFVRYELNAPDEYAAGGLDDVRIVQLSKNIRDQFSKGQRAYIYAGVNADNKYWQYAEGVLLSSPTGETKAFYTFSTDSDEDASLLDSCHDNKMMLSKDLPNNVFFGNSCHSNSFGNNCRYNSFGNNCRYISFGNYCWYNSFGNSCYSNSFGNSCHSNSFGNSCRYNSFGDSCHSNSFSNDCRYISFGNYCYSNSFGNDCYSNSFSNDCRYNSFGNSCHSNSFGNTCHSNSFSNDCYSNSFGNSCRYISFGNYCRYNKTDDGVNSVILSNSQTASANQQIQNYHLTRGLGSQSIEVERNRAYETTVAVDSAGNVKQFCIADIIQ